MNRIEIARQYVGELLTQRQDIIAAWVGGSVARGEETDQSDIDLVLMVAGTGAMNRAGFDLWREGVYIEAGLSAQQEYADLEAVLKNPFRATQMNDALILYDPTGFVKQTQDAVRSVYMQPKWLHVRLNFWLERIRTNLAQFKEAVAAADALRICVALGWFTYGCSSIPLLRAGITPSSTRGLLLLGPVAPTLKAQLTEFEGSAQMNVEDVLALEPLLQKAMPLFAASYGQLPLYFVPKSLWMARQGHYQEALHTMWMYIGAGAGQGCLDRNDPAQLSAGVELMQRWLHQLGMHEPSGWKVKIQGAEHILQQMEVLVNDIEGH